MFLLFHRCPYHRWSGHWHLHRGGLRCTSRKSAPPKLSWDDLPACFQFKHCFWHPDRLRIQTRCLPASARNCLAMDAGLSPRSRRFFYASALLRPSRKPRGLAAGQERAIPARGWVWESLANAFQPDASKARDRSRGGDEIMAAVHGESLVGRVSWMRSP